MAWTTPRTWTTGETVTAAMGNEQWRDNASYLKTEADKHVSLDVVTADVEVVNSAAKTALWTFTLPANTLGSANQVEFEAWLSCYNYYTNPSGAITLAVEYGGTSMVSFVPSIIYTTPGRAVFAVRFTLKGNAATNAQRIMATIQGWNSDKSVSNTVNRSEEGTATVDSTSGQTLALYVTHATANAAISSICRSARLDYRGAL